jgi:hypothetical protein
MYFSTHSEVYMPTKFKVSADTLTVEWLADLIIHTKDAQCGLVLAERDVVSEFKKILNKEVFLSREMEIAFANHIRLKENFNAELDKFFIENYPETLKNAMKLAFRYYLGDDIYDKSMHPHFQDLLNLIREKLEFSGFYKICCSLKKEFDTKAKIVKDTWGKIKGIRFEKAIIAVGILHLREFLPYFDKILEQEPETLKYEECFLKSISIYLDKTKEHWKPNYDLWKNESKWWCEIGRYSGEVIKDKGSLEKINDHIKAIMVWHAFRYSDCESFIFDKTFDYNTKKYDNEDDILCNMKNLVLLEYYQARNWNNIEQYLERSKKEHPNFSEVSHITNANSLYVHTFLLMEYFGIKSQFSYDNKTYNLPELITEKEILTCCYLNSHLKELQDYQNKPLEEVFRYIFNVLHYEQKNRFPVEIRNFLELANILKLDKNNFRLLSTDISDEKSRINLTLYNMFHCGQSDLCITFPYIRATANSGYLDLLNLLKRGSKNEQNERKDEAKQIEKNVAKLFEKCPIFANAKITIGEEFENGEIDVAIYKDKILILVEVKSTYGIVSFDERFIYEKKIIHAGHQLNKAINALKENEELLASITRDNIKFDELKIEAIIISTSFEFDGKKFQGHKKLSLLELMVLLCNDTYDLICFAPKIVKQFKNDPNSIPNVSYLSFYNTENPSIEDFLKALNSNIWEKILPYWKEML